jgi:Fur family ferric uptake transcriptional regulator
MKHINKILQKKNVRITSMRQLILNYFIEQGKAVGLSKMHQAFNNSDRITIYRTLKTFKNSGIIHSIGNGMSEVKYALCNEQCSPTRHNDHHPHFQCKSCKEVTCMNDLQIPSVVLPNGYTQEEVEMIIKGVCPNC